MKTRTMDCNSAPSATSASCGSMDIAAIGRASIGRARNGRASIESAAHALLIAALFAFAACQSHSSMPRAVETRSDTLPQAEAATRTGNWKMAAECWYSIFVSEDGKTVKPCAETARALLKLKDAESASNVLDRGLLKHPDDPDLNEMKGEALVALNYRRPAEDCFQKALKVDPTRVSALISLAKLRIALGYEGSAVAPLQKAIEITGGDFESYQLLARASSASGDPCGAYQAWVKAFTLGDGSVDSLVTASTLYMNDAVRRAHKDAASSCKRWLERAVERDPQCTQAHFELGVLHEELGNKEAAIKHYRRAVETDPGCLVALRNLAVLYASMGDEAKMREMVMRALPLEQDADRRRALLRLLEPLERKPVAREKSPQQP